MVRPQDLLAVGQVDASNGFLPGWAEANEICPGVCQSWVSTTFWNALAILLMTGMTSSPLPTARLPPGRKQFCTSTTTRAASAPGLSLSCASARGTRAASEALPAAAENERREKSCMWPSWRLACRSSPAYASARFAGSALIGMMLARGGLTSAALPGEAMPLHLIKLCVGCDSIEDLAAWQAERLKQRRKAGEKKPRLFHRTFQTPKRREELLDGGSLYWVIKGLVQVRQPLLDITEGTKEDGTPCCLLILKNELVPVRPMPRRAFQGWRYLDAEEAPATWRGAAATSSPCRPSCASSWPSWGCCRGTCSSRRLGSSEAQLNTAVSAPRLCWVISRPSPGSTQPSRSA